MIRQNGHIKGYTINGTEVKVSQYADDTTLFLGGSEVAFEKCIETLGEFEKYSGLKMNQDKAKVIWFGCPRPPETIYLPNLQFDWNPRKFSVLRTTFSTDLERITENNIQHHWEKVKMEIKNWDKRKLTPFGNICVIKT
ncbi:reverse transcriptase [Plakobranchus ocellatus]|uniref:Reverse transcriptase n=1 Tax=Plakobranchus ocellatus TaxID=259542 RepID=A0AAV4B8C4_9GAST|nr:reverse transcriptase [Plakobranchus ocellatus]